MKPPSRARKIFDWIFGLTLVAIGFVGLFVPILQGVVLIVAGLAVLSSHSRWARLVYERIKGAGRKVRERIAHRRDRGPAAARPETKPEPTGEDTSGRP